MILREGLPSTTHVSTECSSGRIASPYSRACPHGVTSNASTMTWAPLEVVVPLAVITRV